MTTVDSHHHFWDLSKLDYDWMPPPPSVLVRDYLPEDMKPLIDASGVDRTVVVQAHQSIEEAEFLLDLAEANDFIAGVVGWVDLTDPKVGYTLDRLTKRRKFKGVRHLVHDEPDDAWLARDDVARGLKELVFRGLAYDVLAQPVHLKYVPQVAEKLPDLKMVVDHIAKPAIADGVMEPWATDIAAVAEIPGVHCKVSGMVTEAGDGWTADTLKPYVAHVVDIFGMDRLMWGSDWPVCRLAGEYDQVLNAALDAIGPLSDDDRAAFLGGNATRFYRL